MRKAKQQITKTFIVLGMHRSATSLIAKSLSKEICLGSNFLPPSPINPKGFFEDRDFVKLNDRILNKAGGSWQKPPPEESIVRLAPTFGPRIALLLEDKFCDETFYGWKDPRTTLTIRLYLPYLKNPHFISCFREPDEVAKSLVAVGGFTLESAKELTKIYNQRLLKFLTEFTNK